MAHHANTTTATTTTTNTANTMSHSNPQRDMIASALVLLLRNIDPKLDVSHFARHTPLKAEMKNSHDAATFLRDCSQEFGINLTTPEAREEAQWALAGSAASMHGHHTEGTGSAFAFADFILKRLELEGKTYSNSAFEQLQGKQGTQRV